MSDGSLIFDTKIDDKGFKKGIAQLKSVGNAALKTVAKATVATTAVVAGMGLAAIKVGSDFEAGMSQVAATMGISSEAIAKGDKTFQALEKAAREAGATTQFSATEASEALNYLALAGYDADKAIDALPKVLNLAAAGGMELGYAADIATNSMNALGLDTNELGGFIDQLAKTSQKSGTDISQLGEAILTVGGTAKILKGGTVELNTQLGILADAGIKGAEGGTALRNVLLALSAPTDKQSKLLKQLGVDTYDANGNFRATNEIFEDLNDVLGTMTEQERTEVLSNLFNKVDLKAANALLDNSGDRFNALSKEIENSEGAADEFSKTLNDNLQGQLRILASSLSKLGITIYQGIDTPLKEVVKTLIGYVDKITATITAHEDIKESMDELGISATDLGIELGEVPTGFAGAVEILGGILADMVTKVAQFVPKMLEVATSIILAFIKGIKSNQSKIIRAVLDISQEIISSFLTVLPEMIVLGIEMINGFMAGMVDRIPDLIGLVVQMFERITQSILENLPSILESGMLIILALLEGMIEMLPKLFLLIFELILTIVDGIVENLPRFIEIGTQLILSLIEGLNEALPQLNENMVTIITTIVNGILENLPALIEAAISIVEALIDFISDNLDMLIDSMIKVVMAIVEGLINNLDKLIDAALKLINAIVEGLVNNIDKLIDAAFKLVIAIVEGLLNNLPQIINAAIKLALGIVDGLLQMLPTLVSTAIQLIMGIIGAILRTIPQLISVGLQLVGELIVGIIKAIPRVLKAGVTLIKTVIKGIKSGFTGIVNIGKELVKGLWNGITGMGSWIKEKVKGFANGILDSMKGVFGIHSPSTVMRDMIGKNLTLGIGVGIEQGMPELNRDVDKEMAALTKKMKATVDFEAGSIGTKISASNSINELQLYEIPGQSSEIKKDTLITGNNFYIREEGDIKKVARELHKLEIENQRGRG